MLYPIEIGTLRNNKRNI